MDDPETSHIARQAVERLKSAENEVKTILKEVDASVVLATYSLYRLIGMQKEDKKHSRPAPAAIELAAWVCYPEFGQSSVKDGGKIQAAITCIEKHELAYTMVEIFPDMPDEDSKDKLNMHLRMHSGIVRGSAFANQIVNRIQAVLQPFELELARISGVGSEQASDLVKALVSQMEDNINAMREEFHATMDKIGTLEKKGHRLTGEDKKRLEELKNSIPDILGKMEGEWVPQKSQIESRLGGGELKTQWESFKNIVGFTRESRQKLVDIVDVQDRPIFFLDPERAFTLHGGACLDAVFTYFDDLLRRTPLLCDRYGKLVAQWMEYEIEKYLKRLFPSSLVLRSACFPDPDNVGGETEADVIVIWGPFLLIVEAKGKRVPREALRGSRQKLKQTLSKNIQDAFIQSRRVLRILERDEQILFKEKQTGRTLEVKYSQLRRVMSVSVTLQHLSGIPTQLAVTQGLGLFKGNTYPWSVSLDDLEVITRFANSPDIFLHYIERRIAHQNLDVGFHGDELDLFGQYLQNRLHPSLYEKRIKAQEGAGPAMIAINGGDEVFSPYYHADWYGEPIPETTVELNVPDGIKIILNELRHQDDFGARWIAFALLGFSRNSLVRIAKGFEQVSLGRIEGRRIIRVIFREDDIVVNIMAHKELSEDEFIKNVTLRSRLEHYRHKPVATFTLGVNQRDKKNKLAVAQWVEGPCEYDPMIEKIIADDHAVPRLVQLPAGAKKVGVNDPCPCGSGKKFKKCCKGMIVFQRTHSK